MNYLQMKKKALLNYVQSGGGRLPSEYQEVEWIGTQGQGNEYLRLQQQASISQNTDTFRIGVELNSGTSEQGFMGVPDYAEVLFMNNKFSTWGHFASSQSGTSIQFLTKYDLEWYATRDLHISNRPTLLFAYATNRYYFNGKIYYFKWLNTNNELVLDLVPCYRKSDNEIGMYDLINDDFYTNSGSGQFTKGADV